MLSLKNVTAGYGEQRIIQQISMQVLPGEIAVILGLSGAGKSTLLKTAAGLLQPMEGGIFWKDEKVKGPKDVLVPGSDDIKWVAQDFDLMPFISAVENVGAGAPHLLDDEKEERAIHLLELFGLKKWAHNKANMLSGGQQQRVALAKALMSDAPCLLFDEVFSQLDTATALETMVLLKNYLKTQKKAALFVLHNPAACFYLADKVSILADGKLVQTGTPSKVFNNPATIATAQLFGYVNVLPHDFAKRVLGKTFNVMGEKIWFRPAQIKESDIAVSYSCIDTYFTDRGTIKVIEIEDQKIWLEV